MGVPNNIMIPFIGISFDDSQAFTGPARVPIEPLIVGQKLAAGVGLPEVKYPVSSPDEVAVLAGFGSMAHKQAQAYFAQTQLPARLVMLDDAAGSAAASLITTITGTSTKQGTLAMYYNGIRIAVGVAIGDTATEIGEATLAKVAEIEDFPATVANNAGALTWTPKNKGIIAGDIDFRLNHNASDVTPEGVEVSIGAITPGTVDPLIQDAIDVIGDDWFQLATNPYTDTTNVTAAQTYAAQQDVALVQKDMVWFAALRADRTALLTYGQDTATKNSKHVQTRAWYKRLQSTYEGGAAIVGAYAQSLIEDIGQPLHRIKVNGITALDPADRWETNERNQLATNAIATMTDGTGVQTEGEVTMFLKNSAGAASPAYRLVSTVWKLMYCRYTFRVGLLTQYPRARLLDSNEKLAPGDQAITPAEGTKYALDWFRQMEREGICENYNDFKEKLVVRRSESNKDRLEWLLPNDLVNEFIVGSGDLQFRL